MSKEKTVNLHKSVKPFTNANHRKSTIQLVNTIPPLLLIWVFAYLSLSFSVWLSIGLSVIASGFIVRCFIIFHDCTHGSFYRNKKKNNILGTITDRKSTRLNSSHVAISYAVFCLKTK